MDIQLLEINCAPKFAIFFLAHTTLQWHHLTGSPMGTGSMKPNRTSWSNPALTSSRQYRELGQMYDGQQVLLQGQP
jgi:hypothetical protein